MGNSKSKVFIILDVIYFTNCTLQVLLYKYVQHKGRFQSTFAFPEDVIRIVIILFLYIIRVFCVQKCKCTQCESLIKAISCLLYCLDYL